VSHLAVVQTPTEAYKLVKEINGKYFEIEGVKTLSDALSHHLGAFRKLYEAPSIKEVKGKLVAPVAVDSEIWGAGVTYQRSRDARKEESGIPDVYQLVYEADRPELFFKATARRTVGTEGEVGIREDAQTSVPEPEVAIVVNKFRE
jgi:2-dehydro-3-deoxy-D-arabinonate dehydratase